MNGKYSPGMLVMCQKLPDHANRTATDPLKTSSKGVNHKTAEATGDWIHNKFANRNTKN